MKVIIYIDGEHDSVEVKDKIHSVLPDTGYMIFDTGEIVDKTAEALKEAEKNLKNILPSVYHTAVSEALQSAASQGQA